MAVPRNSEIPRVCASPEFQSLVERAKRELQVSIVPNVNISSHNGSTSSDTPAVYSFKFRCQRSNSDFLITAREMLEQFLLNHNIRVYPSPTSHSHKRGDSFAEAFPHFDSKLLSTAKTHHGMLSYGFDCRSTDLALQNLLTSDAPSMIMTVVSALPILRQMSRPCSMHLPIFIILRKMTITNRLMVAPQVVPKIIGRPFLLSCAISFVGIHVF